MAINKIPYSLIKRSQQAIILGLEDAQAIRDLQEMFPDLQLTVVEPRLNLIQEFIPGNGRSIQYITTIEGIEKLQQRLRHTPIPIPVIKLTDSWYPEKIFFGWASQLLIEEDQLKGWRGTPSEFILGSLFV